MQRVDLTSLAVANGVVGGPFGSSLVGADYVDEGVPVIRGSNMGSRYVRGPFAYVTPTKQQRDLARNIAQPGDLVFTQRGTLGQVAIVDDSFTTLVISQSQMRLRLDPLKADTNYVYYAAQTDDFLSQIDHSAVRTGVPHINLGTLGKLEIPLPPLPEQQAIAEVLGALDDKIAANRALATSLADLSQLEFTEARATAKSSIPMERAVATEYGLTTSASEQGQYRLVRVTDMNKNPWVDWENMPAAGEVSLGDAQKYALHPEDVLVARMADPGKVAIIEEGDPPAVFASYLIRVTPREDLSSLYLFHFMRSAEFQEYAFANSTGSVQRNMNARVIVGTSIPLPTTLVMDEFTRRCQANHAAMAGSLRESTTLAKLRDTLLPALMDGTIRVKDAITKAEEVL